jgi:hypothetical protein
MLKERISPGTPMDAMYHPLEQEDEKRQEFWLLLS